MKIVTIPKFSTPYGTLEFVPVSDVPGMSHRVALDGELQQLYLPNDKRPTKRMAQFFIRVYYALKENRPKYHYVDLNQDPPLPTQVSS